ncbi:MAG: hypothetical protein AABX59_03285 [Nanoarchaeota archaeon]
MSDPLEDRVRGSVYASRDGQLERGNYSTETRPLSITEILYQKFSEYVDLISIAAILFYRAVFKSADDIVEGNSYRD